MVNINELRIGNWISPLGLSYTQVEGFSIRDNIIESSMFADRGEDDFEPIQLTPEILEAAGFEKSPTNGFYVNNAMWLETTPFVTPIYCDGTGFRRYIGKHIKYLHQLQNLYYYLSGEELKINIQ